MKKLLLGLLLALPSLAQAQFGSGAKSGFGQNVDYKIEHGTYTPSGAWDFTFSPTFTLPANTTVAGGGSIGGDAFVGSMRTNDFLGLVDGIQDTFTLSTEPASGSLLVVLDGIAQDEGPDYSVTVDQLVMASPPEAGSSSFWVQFITKFGSAPLTQDDLDTHTADPGAHHAEVTSLAHSALTGIGTSDHHVQTVDTNTNAETICSAGEYLNGTGGCDTLATGPHTTSLAHSALTGVGTSDHHAPVTTLAHSALTGIGTSDHHAPVTTLAHSALTGVGASDHHAPVTTLAHSALTGIGTSDHHVKTVDTDTTDHSLFTNVTASQHHTKTTDASELTSGTLDIARIANGAITSEKLASGALSTFISSATSNGETTTTSANFQPKLSSTFTVTAGVYQVTWSAEMTNSNGSAESEMRLYHDSGTEFAFSNDNPGTADSYYTLGGVFVITRSAGPFHVGLQFRALGATAKVRRARVIIQRVTVQ